MPGDPGLAPDLLREAAEGIAAARWGLVGHCAVVSRQVHGHGLPGDSAVSVYLGVDAGRRLYGLQAPGQVVHVDVMHEAGRCEPEILRARLREAVRRFLDAEELPERRGQHLLAAIEARVETTADVGPDGPLPSEAGAPAGHVHLALRAGLVPLEFVLYAVAAAERAIIDSGLRLLRLQTIEPTWQSPLRPPCGCGAGDGPPPAGSGRALASEDGPTVPDLSTPAARRAAAAAIGAIGRDALETGEPGPVAESRLRAAGLVVAAPSGASRSARLAAEGRVLRASVRRRGPGTGGRASVRRATVRGAQSSGGPLSPVATVAAAARSGTPVHVRRTDLRYVRTTPARPDDAILAVDRSPSMGSRLAWAERLADRLLADGCRVGLVVLRLDGEPGQMLDLPPTRDSDEVRRALMPLCRATSSGGTALADGLRGLGRTLAARRVARRTTCFVLTDGLATSADGGADPWASALDAATELRGLPHVRLVFTGGPAATTRLAALAHAAGGGVRVLGA